MSADRWRRLAVVIFEFLSNLSRRKCTVADRPLRRKNEKWVLFGIPYLGQYMEFGHASRMGRNVINRRRAGN